MGFDLLPGHKQDELLRTIHVRLQNGKTLLPEMGFRKPRESYSFDARTLFFEPNLPTMYDYHIVLISKEAVRYLRDLLAGKKDDLDSLMRSPFHGTLVVPIIGGDKYYESWVPILDGLKERDGDSLKLNEKHWAYHFMKKYQKNFTWKAHANYSIVSYDEEQAKRCVATNIADNPIAFEAPLGNGRMLYLPFYNFEKDGEESLFLRDLLDCIEDRYKVPKDELIPSWASKSDYRLPSEEEIERNSRMLEQEKTSLIRIKSMLWLDGTELVNSVAHTLSKIGIQCEVKEKEGKHDIEILEPELHAVVEVKGLSGFANHQDMRQLLDWQVEAWKGDESIKGIFVLNDFRDTEPELRQTKMREKITNSKFPFTREAERIAISNHFCLLTTYQLFQIFKQSTSGKFNKLDFVKKLSNTNGVFLLAT